MAVVARIEVVEEKLEVFRVPHKNLAWVFGYSLESAEIYIYNLSLSLQVAYLGAIVLFPDVKDEIKELLDSVIPLSSICIRLVGKLRNALKIIQASKEEGYDFDDVNSDLDNLAEKFRAFSKKAKMIHKMIKDQCPDPERKLKEIYERIAFISNNEEDTYFMKHIRISHQLQKVKRIQLEITILAAIGCFKKGMKHAKGTLKCAVQEFSEPFNIRNGFDFIRLRRQVTWVVIATASALYLESIDSALCELGLFLNESADCTPEDANYKLQGLFEHFMKNTESKVDEIERRYDEETFTTTVTYLQDEEMPVNQKTPEKEVEDKVPETPEKEVEDKVPETPEKEVEDKVPETPEKEVEDKVPETPEKEVEDKVPETPEKEIDEEDFNL